MAPLEVDRWLGRQWREGEYECADLVREVLWEHGVEAEIPHVPRTIPSRARILRRAESSPAWRRVECTRPLDVVAMLCLFQQRVEDWHLGVVAGSGPVILHLAPETGVTCVAAADIALQGYRIEGFFRWAR